jgi:hypothetical protein
LFQVPGSMFQATRNSENETRNCESEATCYFAFTLPAFNFSPVSKCRPLECKLCLVIQLFVPLLTSENHQKLVGWVEAPRRYPSPLSELVPLDLITCSPVQWIHPKPHKSLKRRVGPLANRRDMPMLYRIEVNVIAMPFEIDLVTQGVFPFVTRASSTHPTETFRICCRG